MLRVEDVSVMKNNIAIKLCNLEKIFPPSFFDVMEHLPVHLPDEAALGGPVQYRWMYPFERYMYHLKKKVKNKARIGGSIVAQCVQEEISYAASNYYGNTEDGINDGPGEIRFAYDDYPSVPNIFHHIGRVSGRRVDGWLEDPDYNIIQTFMLLNSEEFAPSETMFEEAMRVSMPGITDDEMGKAKDAHYAKWCRDYINEASKNYEFPLWMLEFIQGPRNNYTSWPMYFTRGYHFHNHRHGQDKRTQNYGVVVRGTIETTYYGLIEEIMKIEYRGGVGLKAMIFRCSWFDNTDGIGLRRHPFGLVDVAPRRRYEKYDPFVLAGQCDQVCFIPYPRVSGSARDDWWACAKVIPRGYRENDEISLTTLQDDTVDNVVVPSSMIRVTTHVVDENASDYDDLAYVEPLDYENVEDDGSGQSSGDSDSSTYSEI